MLRTYTGGRSVPARRPRVDFDAQADLDFIRRANRELAHWPAWTRVPFENLNFAQFDGDGNPLLDGRDA